MDWQQTGSYRDHVIWTGELERGRWVAAVVPASAPTEGGALSAPPSEEMLLPVTFDSEAAATDGAKRYIDREHARRVPQTEIPEGEEGAPETGRMQVVRRFERVPVSLPAIARAPQFPGTALRGVVLYIAAGGLMVELPVEVVSGSTLWVLLQTRQGPREVEGKVVWTAAAGGTVHHGLAFAEPEEPDFLEEFFGEKGG